MTMIDELRNNVQNFMRTNHYKSAVYWSEILLKTDNSNVCDVLNYVEALYHDHEYRRAIYFIEKSHYGKRYLTFRLISARCFFAINDPVNAILVLDCCEMNTNNIMNTSISAVFGNMITTDFYDNEELILFNKSYKELETDCFMLLGDIYEQMENREAAVEYYKLTVRSDVRCHAAMQKIHSGNMMNGEEARAFLSSLDYSGCGNEKMIKMIRTSYEDMFKWESDTGNEDCCPSINEAVDNHYWSMLNKATRYYNNSRFKKAYELTKNVLKDDPENPNCIILHAAVLTELRYNNELFTFASALIEKYPDKKESWYAIGCYYMATNKHALAQAQFKKATEIDKFFGAGWLALGHTYSMGNEHDQSLAAYCSAGLTIRGNHLAVLYIALEYSVTSNASVSVNYLQEAMSVGIHDPYCWHEKGFVLFKNKSYSDALKHFLRALEMKKCDRKNLPESWEPLLNNIGHCYKKLRQYPMALQFFTAALSKKPKNPSTLTSIAIVYTLQGDFNRAISKLESFCSLNNNASCTILLMETLMKLNSKVNPEPPKLEIPIIPEDKFRTLPFIHSMSIFSAIN